MNVLKKILLTTFLLISVTIGYVYGDDFHKDHEIRVGVGAFPFSWWNYESDLLGDCCWDDWRSPMIDLEDNDADGDLYIAGSFLASYHIQMLRWLQLGLAVSHTRFWREHPGGKRKSSYTTVMPVVNFTWVNRGIVKLYSGVGVGWDFIRKRNSELEDYSWTTDAGFQLTFVGVTVGRRLFGFSEVGIGNHGFFTLGMGYRLKK